MSRIPEEVLVLSEARWWIAVPSELSPTDIYVLHRCQQPTWILLVPFVEMKCWHWLYSSAIDPLCSCLQETHNAVRHYAYTVSVEQTLLMKGRLAYGPQCRRWSQKWCLSSLIYLHSLSLFSSPPPSLCLWRPAGSPALSAGNCQVQLCVFKIAYMAGSCKRRPGNTSQQHYWFSPSHGLLFLLDLWIYI